MKTTILASIMALTAIAWTSQATAACFYYKGYKYGCNGGYVAGVRGGGVPKKCQVRCANAETPQQRLACYKAKC
jgi:hypothetical protein